ncbi:hypothetical protein Fot_32022 [Forsythia ovata]|uniref:Uncharacterized protein n=1 Tax=Forsythia ovata TaxID=205694 RepID=A0ABD1T6Q4_9LAMI
MDVPRIIKQTGTSRESGVHRLFRVWAYKKGPGGETGGHFSRCTQYAPDPASKITVVVDSYWTEEWVTYSDQSSPSLKLSAPKAMAAWSPMLIEKAEIEVRVMELNKKNSKMALRNADHIIRDQNHFKV